MKDCFNSVAEFVHGTKGTGPGNGPFGAAKDRKKTKDGGGKKSKDAGGPKTKTWAGTSRSRSTWWRRCGAGKRYNEGYYGANSSMTAALGRLATYSGKVVKWDDAWPASQAEFPKRLAWDAPAPVQKDADGNYPIPIPGVFVPC